MHYYKITKCEENHEHKKGENEEIEYLNNEWKKEEHRENSKRFKTDFEKSYISRMSL